MSSPKRSRAHAWSLVALVATSACSERTQQRVARPERASLAQGASIGPVFSSPARLRYHPRERARALAERSLGGERRLIVGEGGERWVYDPKQRSLRAGTALAPEGLIGMLEGQGEYWFVGSSGTTYAASGWLAPFERSSVPAEPLTSVTTAGTAIVGISPGRVLLRSTDFGATWTNVGPSGVAFVDVALSPSGVGLALAVPEVVYETTDSGATFRRSALPAIGVLELEVDAAGALFAHSVSGERAPGTDGRWTVPAASRARTPELPQPPRGPDASAMAEGRAVIDRSNYLELASARTSGSYELWYGKLDAPLVSRPFPEAKGCSGVKLQAFDRYVLFACFRARNETGAQPIELYFSDTGGQRFAKLPGRLDGIFGAFRLAVGDDGNFVVSGVCAAPVAGPGCNATGVQHANGLQLQSKRERTRGGPPALGSLSATPSLAEAAQALAFSYDGKIAYAVGRRTKTGRYALFVSRDSGKSFEPEDLDLVPLAMDDDDAGVDRSPSARVEGLSAAEDGAVAITFVTYGRRMLVVTDEQGKLLSSADPPEARSLLGASGLRAISVSPQTRQLWESVDGGVTFQPVSRLPVEVCPNDSSCELPVRCAPEGCVVGQKLSRIGWGGQAEDQASLLPPPLRPPPPPLQRKLRTALACNLDTQPWKPIPGVVEPPDVGNSAIGGLDWYAVAEDPDRAAVTLHVAERGRVAPLVLLEPSDRPAEKAFAVIEQVEGVAALRYRIPESLPGQTNLTDVEVAWTNFFESARANRARLKDGGPFVPGDYSSGPARAQQAAPDLVSVASRGLYLRIHQSGRADQPTLFLDGRRSVSLPPVSWPRGSKLSSRFEVAHIGGAHVPLQIFGRGAAVQRARLEGGRYVFDAMTTGLLNPASFGLTQLNGIAYAGDRSGLQIAVSDEAGTLSTAALYPFQAEGTAVGPALPLPTLLSLDDKPVACTLDRKTRTPRSVAVPTPGTRHPVVVSDSVDGPRTLLTTAAVLYGTPESPCASSFGATFVSPDASPPARESALIFIDSPDRSVLFRVVGDREATRVEYRTMSCRYDPTLEVPGEVYRALGAMR